MVIEDHHYPLYDVRPSGNGESIRVDGDHLADVYVSTFHGDLGSPSRSEAAPLLLDPPLHHHLP